MPQPMRPARTRPGGGRAQGLTPGSGRPPRCPARTPGPCWKAAFAELDTAVDVLRGDAGQASRPSQAVGPGPESLLTGAACCAVFQDAPVPMFLLGPGHHRAAGQHQGRRAARLRPRVRGRQALHRVRGPALPGRGASQLAAACGPGRPGGSSAACCAPDGPAGTELDRRPGPGAGRRRPARGGGRRTGSGPDTGAGADQAAGAQTPGTPDPGDGQDSPARLMEAMIHRYDLVTSATRLFLENATYSESVTLQRCARLLASELAAWVIVDVERRQRLRRQFVMGPEDQPSDLANAVGQVDPAPGTAPRQVHESGSSLLVAHAEDAGILGAGPQGVPVMMMLDATSVLCVPLSDGEHTYGTLTLARNASEGHFEMADLGVVEELGEQLALAIRVDRMFRRHTEIADALQSSLLPRDLPQIPGWNRGGLPSRPPRAWKSAATSTTSTRPGTAGAWRSGTYAARTRTPRRSPRRHGTRSGSSRTGPPTRRGPGQGQRGDAGRGVRRPLRDREERPPALAGRAVARGAGQRRASRPGAGQSRRPDH